MKIYRVSIVANPSQYTMVVNELEVKETPMLYKVLQGNSGFLSQIKKTDLGMISDSVWIQSFNNIRKECFCLAEDVDVTKTKLIELVKSQHLKNKDIMESMSNKISNNPEIIVKNLDI